MSNALETLLRQPGPVLALAPMQDVTDLAFWRLMTRYGGPDLYFTEYFRVHGTSVPDRSIVESIVQNPTGRPVVAQMIGNDVAALIRTAKQLEQLPVAGIDLNLGCPAPVVYRKCAGGGLLRDPARVDAILGALRDAITLPFTVKTRVGFDSPEVFETLLALFARHRVDLVTVHARTVSEMYRSEVRYELIARAAAELPCPVLANGNVSSARKGRAVLAQTGARGLMIGRGAIRNPWIFTQFRQAERGEPLWWPAGRDVRQYIRDLFEAVRHPLFSEQSHITRMKKFMNYLGLGVDDRGQFLHAIRRAATEAEFFRICDAFLDHDEPMPLEPHPLVLKAGDIMAGIHG